MMTDEQVRQWIDVCNHEPARQVLRDYMTMRDQMARNVDEEAIEAVIACLGDDAMTLRNDLGDENEISPNMEEAAELIRSLWTSRNAHLSQPQPIAQGEAVAWHVEWDMCDERARMVTMYKPDPKDYEGENTVVTPLYKATPTIPTGHRLVPYEWKKIGFIELSALARLMQGSKKAETLFVVGGGCQPQDVFVKFAASPSNATPTGCG